MNESEPVEQVTPQDVLAMLGSLYVEVQVLRSKLLQANKRIEELTPKENVG